MGKVGRLFCLGLFVFSLGAAGEARAQSAYGRHARLRGLREVEIGKALSQMAGVGAKPEDFVPPHWKIFSRAEGDLNADGVADFAFILTLDERDTKYVESLSRLDEDDSWIWDAFVVVVVDSRGDRRHHLTGVNYQLFGDTGATPAGDERSEFKVEIKRNVLDVRVNFGGMQRTEATFHFRWQPSAGTLTLIGFDVENYCVNVSADCGPWRVSENYLTSTRVETTYKLQGGRLVGADRRTSLPPVEVDFTDARLNQSNKKDVLRPF